MQLFDQKAVSAAACAADVLAQRQAGDDSPRGQSGQLVGQSLCSLVGERLGARLTLQKQLRLGVVGQDQVCGLAQRADAVDEGRGDGGIGLAVVAHHRVHHLFGSGPVRKCFFGQRYLCLAAQIAGIDAVKLHTQSVIMLQRLLAVGRAVQPCRGAQTARVGGKHYRGQGHRLHAHDRQHRQDDRQTAAAYAGKIVDAENFFGFNRVYQIRGPPCQYAVRAAAGLGRAHRPIINFTTQYTTNFCIKKADTRYFIGNNNAGDRIFSPKGALKMRHETNSSSGMLLGMAAGAALGAVGVMAATQNQRQLRRTTRKVVKGAENAVLQLDKMVGDFVEKHMEG